MGPWSYSCAGLQVASDLQIPEWAAFERPHSQRDADVIIAVNRDPRWHDPPAGSSAVTATDCAFRARGVAVYRVQHGRTINVSVEPDADLREVRLFLLGSAWGALCYQRGLLVLHASAVRTGDEAIAFCGLPGMGKSSTAAWLTTRGYSLISDDLTRVAIDPERGPVIYPAAARLKLWRDALEALGWSERNLQRDRTRHEKFDLPLGGGIEAAPVRLRVIYLLEWGEPQIERLTGRAALSRFVPAATYRRDLLEPMGHLGAYWRDCLDLMQRVPVYTLRRQRRLSAMEELVALVEDHREVS
jgi:hypothetical protein